MEEEYKLVDVTTQTAPMIQNPEGKVLSIEQALVELLNGINKLVKKLV
jgi:hypothetical protein